MVPSESESGGPAVPGIRNDPVGEGEWEWAVVSLVPESELPRDRLDTFFSWLSEEVTAVGWQELEKRPRGVLVVDAGSKGGLTKALRGLSAARPGLVHVFAVMPKKDCEEHEWLKAACADLALAFQAILKDNVASDFHFAIQHDTSSAKKLTKARIVANISDQFATKLRHFTGTSGNKRGLRGPRANLRVVASGTLLPEIALAMVAAEAEAKAKDASGAGDAKTRPPHHAPVRTAPKMSLTQDDLASVVAGLHPGQPSPKKQAPKRERSQHSPSKLNGAAPVFQPRLEKGKNGYGQHWAVEAGAGPVSPELDRELDVLVTGFPAAFSQWQVAMIFHEFRVKNVRLAVDANAAFVRLANRKEAQEAVHRVSGRSIGHNEGPGQVVSVVPAAQANLLFASPYHNPHVAALIHPVPKQQPRRSRATSESNKQNPHIAMLMGPLGPHKHSQAQARQHNKRSQSIEGLASPGKPKGRRPSLGGKDVGHSPPIDPVSVVAKESLDSAASHQPPLLHFGMVKLVTEPDEP